MTDWIEGRITDGRTGEAVEWRLKASDEPSELHGINGGKIIKLEMQQNGKTVFNYNRGLEVKTQTTAAIITLAILLNTYN